jgi:hypothetical protein
LWLDFFDAAKRRILAAVPPGPRLVEQKSSEPQDCPRRAST